MMLDLTGDDQISPILGGMPAGRMDVAEAKESQRPAELAWTFERDGVRLAAERMFRLGTGKELEAEGCPIMDDLARRAAALGWLESRSGGR